MENIYQNAMEQAVLQVAKQMEDRLDEQLHQIDHLGEDDLERVRQTRIDELKKQAAKKQHWLQNGHGEIQHLLNEKEFFAAMKGEDRLICHFYRENWPCKVIDKHLGVLCRQHLETKFCKIDAEKSPYLTEKLKIWMLPTLALVKSEKVVDYVVGFDDLGGRDDFTTEQLAARLAQSGAIKCTTDRNPHPAGQPSSIRKSEYASQKTEGDEDSDFD